MVAVNTQVKVGKALFRINRECAIKNVFSKIVRGVLEPVGYSRRSDSWKRSVGGERNKTRREWVGGNKKLVAISRRFAAHHLQACKRLQNLTKI